MGIFHARIAIGQECIFRGDQSEFSDHPGYSIQYVRELERRLRKAKAAPQEQGRVVPRMLKDSLHADLLSHPTTDEPHQRIGLQNGNTSNRLLGKDSFATLPEDVERPLEASSNEFSDVNQKTWKFEFHGHTSLLGFLGRLLDIRASNRQGEEPEGQIVEEFQNDRLSPPEETPTGLPDPVELYYPHHAILFIDTYFKSLHYIYPVIDQYVFMERSQALWTGQNDKFGRPVHQGFKSLYFAVLSLGALTRTWTEGSINGMDRYGWSDMLFEKSEALMGRPGSLSNLEAVQTLILLAQICQQQLNPNLAYTYLGQAVRTVFSAGMNRLTHFRSGFPQDSPGLVVSRTWWALYSLETECSVMLGRPDILGSDSCHNRPPPPLTGDTEAIIVPAMLGLSKILRRISKEMYWEHAGLGVKVEKAGALELELDAWAAQLPAKIRPTVQGDTLPALGGLTLNNHYWPELQKLMLRLRYLHAKTILFYLFFLHTQQKRRPHAEALSIYARKCTQSAVELIEGIHAAYCLHHFFRTWWNNTTYIAFGLSILLSLFAREPIKARPLSENLAHIEKALELLEVMNECSVARNIGNLARELVDTLLTARTDDQGSVESLSQLDMSMGINVEPPNQWDTPMGFDVGEGGMNVDFNSFNFFETFPLAFETTDGPEQNGNPWGQ
ncbi:hypothetical protein K402DRAFT_461868 [Aulographum hederae CBS 113979]|uniref:Xylanolytic transcriptional activator regulatory domain-containing protein n=1 Tax=Aulographum hederae CBS 113979 TaxID=1176131 RepID=A0A6G1H663_9PEZI|nr:hypothetical protein K402DRAFT_461868 [Aulographum hederae CBS 113979]